MSQNPQPNYRTDVPSHPRVVYEGRHLMVVDKEYDLVINCDDPKRPSVAKQLEEKFPLLADPNLQHAFRFVNRLDYATSGLLVVASTPEGATVAGKAFQKRDAQKFYLAILRGHIEHPYINIKEPIGEMPDPEQRKLKMATPSCPGGCVNPREASTDLLVLSRGTLGSKPGTKVLLKPLTGRRHQLRVHCARIGHIIAGDYTYSDGQDSDTVRMFLHSHRLVLPNKLEPLSVTADDPFKASDSPENSCVENTYSETEVIHELNDETYSLFEDKSLFFLNDNVAKKD